jgi:hypothetical protein
LAAFRFTFSSAEEAPVNKHDLCYNQTDDDKPDSDRENFTKKDVLSDRFFAFLDGFSVAAVGEVVHWLLFANS